MLTYMVEYGLKYKTFKTSIDDILCVDGGGVIFYGGGGGDINQYKKYGVVFSRLLLMTWFGFQFMW